MATKRKRQTGKDARGIVVSFRINKTELKALRGQVKDSHEDSPHTVARRFVLTHLGLAA